MKIQIPLQGNSRIENQIEMSTNKVGAKVTSSENSKGVLLVADQLLFLPFHLSIRIHESVRVQ